MFALHNNVVAPVVRGAQNFLDWAGLHFGRLWGDFWLIEVWGLATRSEGLANRSEGLWLSPVDKSGAGPARAGRAPNILSPTGGSARF